MSVLVVLDTNIIVSAGIQPAGPSAHIVDALVEGAIVMAVCPAIISEYVEVVNWPRLKKWKFPPLRLNYLIDEAHRVDGDLPDWPCSGPAPDDLKFLALAHRTGAVLVTGNKADYPASIRHGVAVMTAREYLLHLKDLMTDR